MNKREFLRIAGLASMGLAILPLAQCQSPTRKKLNQDKDAGFLAETAAGLFTLPELGFAYNALAPGIDAETMAIHHSKHHSGYVKKLNKVVKGSNYQGKSLREILELVSEDEADKDVRNNAGGHYNHSLFWEILMPGDLNKPNGKLMKQINKDFGSFEAFKNEFSSKANSVFGSGWTWLCLDKNNKLCLMNSANQDNPLMTEIVDESGIPLMCIDVWEHAYYLNYQNNRKDYIANFLNLVNWNFVSEKYEKLIV